MALRCFICSSSSLQSTLSSMLGAFQLCRVYSALLRIHRGTSQISCDTNILTYCSSIRTGRTKSVGHGLAPMKESGRGSCAGFRRDFVWPPKLVTGITSLHFLYGSWSYGENGGRNRTIEGPFPPDRKRVLITMAQHFSHPKVILLGHVITTATAAHQPQPVHQIHIHASLPV